MKNDSLKKIFWLGILLILCYHIGIELYSQSYFGGSVADDAYYIAVADAFLETGQSRDITVNPARPTLTGHWGITLYYSVLRLFQLDFVQISIITMLLGIGFHVCTIFPLNNIAKRWSLPSWVPPFIVLYLLYVPVYYNPVLAGRTESVFFPLSLFWFAALLKWIDHPNNWKKWGLLLILSITMYAFRMQAIIFFIALILGLMITKNIRKSIAAILISGGAVGVVLTVNYLITGLFSSRGEAAVGSNLSSIGIESLINNLPLLVQILNYPSEFYLTYISSVVAVLVMIAATVYVRKNWEAEHLIAYLIILGAVASFLLALPGHVHHGHLRYTAYAIPFLLMLGLKQGNQFFKNHYAMIGICLLGILPTLKVFQSDIRHLGHVKGKYESRVDRYYEMKEVLSENSGKLYGIDLQMHTSQRLAYVTSNQSVTLIDSLKEIERKEELIITTENFYSEHTEELETPVYRFKINFRYVITKLQ